ncbi:DNA sulfur modification protein DndB [Sphingopyxis sp. JAI108]|uniref:DNA sulfur modification protein DndB n=1 Tax=Sphingopyxis sp. JAI108 TaxID=2723060 RepID=UPI0015CEA768|nr:DNA sulfur modification protein DndB [Sphingopyxis sp. JAI108]NYF30663.1 DGQHR domain-containing protein [Sphingopyxis sp. JAI108]
MAHLIKAVKGSFFGTPYWSGKMKLAAISNVIKPPADSMWDEIFEGHSAQRDLTKSRVMNDMVPYLLKPDYHPFFSALTLILVPVDGEHLVEGTDYKFKAGDEDGDVGELVIEDQVLLFPADGQHRQAALAEAFRQRKSLATEEVPVILLPFDSVKRVRQLFSDLNLNAKIVSKTLGLSYESRNPVVVVANRVMKESALFDGGNRVNLKSNSLAAKSPAVISMNTLVEVTQTLLAAVLETTVKGLKTHPDMLAIENADPDDAEVMTVAQKVVEAWEVIVDAFPRWQDVIDGEISAGALRDGVKNAEGELLDDGYVAAFGIGWQALGLIAAAVIRIEGDDWSEQLERAIGSVDWQKGPQWNGTAMIGGRVNNTGPGIRNTAGYVLDKAGYGDTDDDEAQALIDSARTAIAATAEVAAAE